MGRIIAEGRECLITDVAGKFSSFGNLSDGDYFMLIMPRYVSDDEREDEDEYYMTTSIDNISATVASAIVRWGEALASRDDLDEVNCYVFVGGNKKVLATNIRRD